MRSGVHVSVGVGGHVATRWAKIGNKTGKGGRKAETDGYDMYVGL